MTKNIISLLIIAIATTFSSCIREEAPNAECDIVAVDAEWIEEYKEILSGDAIISNNAVRFYVKEETDIELLKELNPKFKLTPGAQIKKKDVITENGERGIIHYYTTTSEDNNYSKLYEVSFTKQTVISLDAVFSFENFSTSGKYTVWHELDASGTHLNWWASGNAGFSMSGMGKTPEDFPTAPDSAGVKGCCVKLTTRDTGTFGKMMKMPIAAGNIFIGEFLTANATKKPLEATRFGMPIAPSRPLSLSGYYKYTPGEVFTDKAKNEIPERRDTCAIYSVLYEIDPANVVTLDGSNVLSSEKIVMVAQLENPGEPTEWTKFEIPFENVNGKKFDRSKLDNGEYAITVVASSSKEGAFFEGAVGSTLHVDEIQIIWDRK